MKKLRILGEILRNTGADRIIYVFLIFVAICSFVICKIEPGISSWREALWFSFTAISTIGFGDVVVIKPLSRMLTVAMSVYGAVVLAIFTGIVVNYFMQLIQLRQKETLSVLLDRLEHLPELSKQELEEISRQIKAHRTKR